MGLVLLLEWNEEEGMGKKRVGKTIDLVEGMDRQD
jgi:hypothetical protein